MSEQVVGRAVRDLAGRPFNTGDAGSVGGRIDGFTRRSTWVSITFHSACTPKVHVEHDDARGDCVRHSSVKRVYDKMSCLCLELDEVDAEGNPIILAYPWRNIFSWTHPHLPHAGMEPRAEKGGDDVDV